MSQCDATFSLKINVDQHNIYFTVLIKCIHVISFKEATGRFAIHFMDIYKKKWIEYIRKFFEQFRKILKFWLKVDSVSILPGLSDHDIVRALVNTIPSQNNQVPRNIPFYKKADWDQFKQTMRDFQSELLTDLATTDVQELWDKFASRLEQGIDKCTPTRKADTRDGFPWINQEIRRLMRKKG